MEVITQEGLPMYAPDSTRRSPQERWSNGIVDVVKNSNLKDNRSHNRSVVAKSLTVALARDLNISAKTQGGHGSNFQRDDAQGPRSSSLNSIQTNPQHGLIRPERIPSNECLSWNSQEFRTRQTIKSQRMAQNGNFQWERSKPIAAAAKRRPNLRNEKKDAIPQNSVKLRR